MAIDIHDVYNCIQNVRDRKEQKYDGIADHIVSALLQKTQIR